MKRFNQTAGFTLIELMATAAVIGIVAAMAVPKFDIAFDRMQFRAAEREIQSTIKLARSLSISDKERYGISFDQDNKTVTLFKDLMNTSSEDFVNGDSVVRVDTLPAEFGLLMTDCDNNVVVFRPNGSAAFTGGGNIYTYASSDYASCYASYGITAATGRIDAETCVY